MRPLAEAKGPSGTLPLGLVVDVLQLHAGLDEVGSAEGVPVGVSVDLLDGVEELGAEVALGLLLVVGPAGGGVAAAFEPVASAGLVVPAVQRFWGVGALVEERLEVGVGLAEVALQLDQVVGELVAHSAGVYSRGRTGVRVDIARLGGSTGLKAMPPRTTEASPIGNGKPARSAVRHPAAPEHWGHAVDAGAY